MVSKAEFKYLDFLVKIGLFINLSTNFCNLADKVLRFRVVIFFVSSLMLNYLTYIYLCRVYLKHPPKYIFYLKIQHFDSQVYFVKCMYCYYLYIWTMPY